MKFLKNKLVPRRKADYTLKLEEANDRNATTLGENLVRRITRFSSQNPSEKALLRQLKKDFED